MKGEPGWIDGVHDKLGDDDYYSKIVNKKYDRNLSK